LLKIDRRKIYLGPVRRFHGLPQTEGIKPPVQQKLRLAFDGGKTTNDIFRQTGRKRLGFNLRDETRRVFPIHDRIEAVVKGVHLRMLQGAECEGSVQTAALSAVLSIRGNSMGCSGAGRIMSATLTSSSVRRTMALMRSQ